MADANTIGFGRGRFRMIRNYELARCTGFGLGLASLFLGVGSGRAEGLKSPHFDHCDGITPASTTATISPCKGFPIPGGFLAEQEGQLAPHFGADSRSVPLPETRFDPSNDLPGAIALTDDTTSPIDIDPELIENSPVLQRWLEEIPDVATDIKHDPAFQTRLRLGYAHFPSNDHTGGLYVGVQDVFVGRTPLTLSADYSQNGRGDRTSYGFDAQYYALPLGSYGNFAPVLGYRHLETPTYISEGVNIGFRVVLIPSRTGAADLSLTQTWVAPGSNDEVGLTTFSVGYAVTSQLRISTDIQTQNTATRQDSWVGVLLEWML